MIIFDIKFNIKKLEFLSYRSSFQSFFPEFYASCLASHRGLFSEEGPSGVKIVVARAYTMILNKVPKGVVYCCMICQRVIFFIKHLVHFLRISFSNTTA